MGLENLQVFGLYKPRENRIWIPKKKKPLSAVVLYEPEGFLPNRARNKRCK
jgi:hypothetical protein